MARYDGWLSLVATIGDCVHAAGRFETYSLCWKCFGSVMKMGQFSGKLRENEHKLYWR